MSLPAMDPKDEGWDVQWWSVLGSLLPAYTVFAGGAVAISGALASDISAVISFSMLGVLIMVLGAAWLLGPARHVRRVSPGVFLASSLVRQREIHVEDVDLLSGQPAVLDVWKVMPIRVRLVGKRSFHLSRQLRDGASLERQLRAANPSIGAVRTWIEP